MLNHVFHPLMAVMGFLGVLFFVQSSHGYQFPSAIALQSVLSIKSSSSILNHACVPSSTSTSITSSTIQQQQQQRQQRIRQFLLPRLQANANDNSVATDTGSLDVFQKLKEKLKGTCVYFVGMMGSGKTTLGRAFSEKMEYRFLDTDEIAEYMIEMPITAFFAEGKVDEFRELENKILTEVSQYTRVVVATGGGIVIKQENWGLLRHGIVVYVDMPVEDIYQRLAADPEQIAKRPLLQDADPLEKLRKLSAERQDKYMQADVHFRLNGQIPHTPEVLANMCAQCILDFIANNPPLWEGWKKKRDMEAVEAAARVNPAATASAGVGFGEQKDKGSIQYVSMQDLESGKVKIPTGPPPNPPSGNSSNSNDDSSKDYPEPLQ